jgi:cytochrome P450
LDRGEDIEGAIASVQSVFAFSTLIGIFAEWYPLVFKILGKFDGSGAAGRACIRKFTLDKVAKCRRLKSDQKSLHSYAESQQPLPLVAKMLHAQEQQPEKISDYHIVMMAQSNIIAGFDSTAVTLSFALFFLLKYPRVLQKLREEIDAATEDGSYSPQITFREAQDLSYFQAFMKEVMRMHSASGLPLWRVIPKGGLQINGRYFPAGAVVGINSWVTHFDEEVFINPHEFRPERWIDSDETKLSVMNEMFIPVSTYL